MPRKTASSCLCLQCGVPIAARARYYTFEKAPKKDGHPTIRMNCKRSYMNHYIEPARFDIPRGRRRIAHVGVDIS
jgi:hypothetical protein